jgi:hypothetical protein
MWQDDAAYRVIDHLIIVYPISSLFASFLSCYLSCSHYWTLFLLILGFSEHVCLKAWIVSEETFGILTIRQRLWTPWDTPCQ